MKFEQTLVQYAVPEWRKMYVNYGLLKDQIDAVQVDVPEPVRQPPENAPTYQLDEYEQQLDDLMAIESIRRFLSTVQLELEKINNFFSDQMAIVMRRSHALDLQLRVYSMKPRHRGALFSMMQSSFAEAAQAAEAAAEEPDGATAGTPAPSKQHRKRLERTRAQLIAAYEEFYRLLDMLKSFRELNLTGFRKILKKFDKNTGLNTLDTEMDRVQQSYFAADEQLHKLITHTEQNVIDVLYKGNRRDAMRALRVPNQRTEPMDWATLRFGLELGILIISIVLISVAAELARRENYPNLTAAFRMFRGLAIPFIMTIFLGVDVYLWAKHNINYVFIFGLNPRSHVSYKDLLETGGAFSIVWAVFALIYVFRTETHVSESFGPLILLGIYAAFLLNPFDIFLRRGRFWLLRVVGRMFAAPFAAVRFEDFWLADQFNSIVLLLQDLQFLICFQIRDDSADPVCSASKYAIRPLITCIPAWIRFAQCIRRYRDSRKPFPHLVNAGKYATTFLVVLFSSLAVDQRSDDPTGPFFALWVVAAALNTTYAYMWDIKMDWGLFSSDAKKRFLRREIVYEPAFYYFAIIANLLLRMAWTANLSIGYFNLWFPDGLVACLALGEMFRRAMWNLIRLENEHLNNCGEFRAIREIPLPFEYIPSHLMGMGDEDFDVRSRSEHPASRPGTAGSARHRQRLSSVLSPTLPIELAEPPRGQRPSAELHFKVSNL